MADSRGGGGDTACCLLGNLLSDILLSDIFRSDICLSGFAPDEGGLRVVDLASVESIRVVGFLSVVPVLKSKSTIDLDLVVLARMSWYVDETMLTLRAFS